MSERRRSPRDDLLSSLIVAEDAGQRLSEDELLATCVLLLIAGHETTANLIGNGVLALLRHPDQLSKLRSDPSMMSSAVEELVRYDSPIQATARTTLTDIEVAGKQLGRGERLVLLLGSANHDPRRFDAPDMLHLERDPNVHLSFGGGIHFCLGAPLARTETRIALATLLDRFPSLTLIDESVRWRQAFPVRGVDALRVRN
jgi:cytochrome P450